MVCYIHVIRRLEKVPLQSGMDIQLAKFMVDNNNGVQDFTKTRGKFEPITNTPGCPRLPLAFSQIGKFNP